LLPVVVLLAGTAGVSGQTTAGEGAAFLMLPVGAHAVSLGRAATAMPGQESAFWNPAGLADMGGSRLVLFRGQSAIGTSTGVSALFSRPGVGTLGISYLLWDHGVIEYRDGENNDLGAESLRNHIAVVSASARLLGRLNAGVNLKLVQSRASCRGYCGSRGASATGYAVDAGIQVTPTAALPLRLGAMVAHLGPRFQHENVEQADPLPTRIRVAAAYDVLGAFVRAADVEGWLTVEVQDRLVDPGSPALYLGSEIAAGRGDRLSLRAGYIAGDPDGMGGASVGLGLQFQNFELSVAKSLALSGMTGETEPFTVVLSIRL